MSFKYYNLATLTLKYKNNSQTLSAISELWVYSIHKSLFYCTKNFCLLSTLFTHFVWEPSERSFMALGGGGFLYEGLGLQTTFRNRSTIQSPEGSCWKGMEGSCWLSELPTTLDWPHWIQEREQPIDLEVPFQQWVLFQKIQIFPAFV